MDTLVAMLEVIQSKIETRITRMERSLVTVIKEIRTASKAP